MPYVWKDVCTLVGAQTILRSALRSRNHSATAFQVWGSFLSHTCKSVPSQKAQGDSLKIAQPRPWEFSFSPVCSLQILATVASPNSSPAILSNSARLRLFPSLNCSLGTATTLSTLCQGWQPCACHVSETIISHILCSFYLVKAGQSILPLV